MEYAFVALLRIPAVNASSISDWSAVVLALTVTGVEFTFADDPVPADPVAPVAPSAPFTVVTTQSVPDAGLTVNRYPAYPAVPDPAESAVSVDCPLAVTVAVARSIVADALGPGIILNHPDAQPVGIRNVIDDVAWNDEYAAASAHVTE